MAYTNDDDYDYVTEKIPYDSEPISREKPSMQTPRSSNSSGGGVSKGIFICFSALVFALVAVSIYLFSAINEIKNYRDISNYNITSKTTNFAWASAKGMNSSVCVMGTDGVENITTEAEFFGKYQSTGSGTIFEIDKERGDAYILTNYHVVATGGYSAQYGTFVEDHYESIYILLWDSVVPIRVSYVGGSFLYDIAVLKVEDSSELRKSSCTAADIGSSNDLVLGEDCLAIGNSMGDNLRVSTGTISIEEVCYIDSNKDPNFVAMFMCHTAAVNSGNSGGGLFDAEGKLIGVVNAKYGDVSLEQIITDDGYYSFYVPYLGEVVQNTNFAIPIDVALSVARNIMINEGHLYKPTFGVNQYFNYADSFEYSNKSIKIDEEKGLRTVFDIKTTQIIGSLSMNTIIKSVSYEYEGKTVNATIDHISSLDSHMYYWKVGDVVDFEIRTSFGTNSTISMTVSNKLKVD